MIIFRPVSVFCIVLFTCTLSSAVVTASTAHRKRLKRQGVSLGDLIDGALNLVRPILDTSKPLQDDTKIPKQLAAETVSYRESEILGSPRYSSLQDVPICRGNSAICKFISCAARNFKSDQSFANLNLAAQVLADTKLRKGISRDPDALLAVCHEQGLSKPECKIFAKGFQLVDKLFTTIESQDAPSQETSSAIHDDPEPSTDEEGDAPPIPIRPHDPAEDTPIIGSRTWSSHPKPIEPVTSKPPVPPPAPPPFGALPTLPPLIFTLPTLPTLATLAPLMPAEQMFKETGTSLKTSFNSDNDIIHNPFATPMQIFPVFNRFRRSAKTEFLDFDYEGDRAARRKRSDYYDQVEDEPAVKSAGINSIARRDPDFRNEPMFDDYSRSPSMDYGRRAQNDDKQYSKTRAKTEAYENCFQYLDQADLHLRR